MKLRSCCALLLIHLAASVALAQTTASLSGTTTPGARVTISCPCLQGTKSTIADANGGYVFASLPPGDYVVDFGDGSSKQLLKRVHVPLGTEARCDADVLTASESLVVRAAPDATIVTPEVATNMPLAMIERLPVQRNQNATAQFAPGVTANTFSNGQLQISGGPGYDNLVLVDGVVVNENVIGQLRPLYVEDAIQETTVFAGAIPVEYGRFTGGVVSTISKWGGNETRGSLRDTLSNPRWSAVTPANEARPSTLNHVWEGTLGGSFVRDRLWYFGSARRAKNDTSRQTVPVPAFGTATQASPAISYAEGNDQKRYEAKVTAQIDPRDNLAATYFKITTDGTNARFNANFYDLASLTTRSNPESIAALRYSGVLAPSLTVDAQFSRRTLEQTSGSTATDLVRGTVLLDRANNNTRFNSPSLCAVCGTDRRNNRDALVKASWHLGSHDLGAGVDRFEEQRLPANDQSGSGFLLFVTRAQFLNGAIYPVITPTTANGGGTFIRWSPVLVAGAEDHLRTDSLYVSDRWTASSRWSASLGLRYDRNRGVNADGTSIARDARVTPRLSVQFDPRGDGRQQLTASVGEYASHVAEAIANNGQIAGSNTSIDFAYRGPAINGTTLTVPMSDAIAQLFNYFNQQQGGTANTAANNLRVNGQRVVPGYSAYFDGSLKTPVAREVTLGYGASIGANGFARVDLIGRDWRDFYAASVTAATQRATTPLGIPVDLLLIRNSNGLHRTYRAVQLQARWRGGRVDAGMHYTWSKLRGNDDDESINGASASLDPAAYYPEVMNYAQFAPTGYLTGDQRHRLRAWGGLTFGDVTATLLQTYDSGLPYSAVGQIARPKTAPYNAVPTGTYFFSDRGAFRTSDIWSTNLALRWSRNVLGPATLFVQADLLNALNRHGIADPLRIGTGVTTAATTTTLQTFDPFTQKPVAGVNYQLASNFGQALNEQAYQTPRTVRFSLGVRF